MDLSFILENKWTIEIIIETIMTIMVVVTHLILTKKEEKNKDNTLSYKITNIIFVIACVIGIGCCTKTLIGVFGAGIGIGAVICAGAIGAIFGIGPDIIRQHKRSK